MYALQNLACLVIPGAVALGLLLLLAARFLQWTKTQLLVMTGAFIVAGLILAAMVNSFAGVLPCLFPALFFGGIGLYKHSRDLQHAQRVLEAQQRINAQASAQAAQQTHEPPRLEPPTSGHNRLYLPHAMDNRPRES